LKKVIFREFKKKNQMLKKINLLLIKKTFEEKFMGHKFG
jgi:hypothetical protein